jgi:hypothetical protein
MSVLSDELTNDPLARGYSGMSDVAATADLNTVYRTQNKTDMSPTEVYNNIDLTEYIALSAANKAEIWNILHLGNPLNPFGLEAIRLTAIFGSGSDTITSLQAARTESISRAQELGLGIVKVGHVAEARA